MEWRDTGIILSLKAYGEKMLLVTLFAKDKGLARGVIYKSKTTQVQMGMQVRVQWKARLESQLGRFDLESLPSAYVFLCFDYPQALSSLQETCVLLSKTLAEHHPYPRLFDQVLVFFEALPTPAFEFQRVVFELELLQALGYGLDLSRCVVTGMSENLVYVSPKSGCAVSKEAGAAYHKKLLPLPGFFLNHTLQPTRDEIRQGRALTAFFIHKHLVAS